VSKTIPADTLRLLYAAGIRDFGENRLQEALPKQEHLQDLTDITWHFIGQLQRNKARKVVEHFHWIHSVDNLPLAQRLSALAVELQRTPQICLQVKLRPDPTKGGWDPQNLETVLPNLMALPGLALRGLMTLPPLGCDPREILEIFQETAALAHRFNRLNQAQNSPPCFQELSMGMSEDYPLAIAAGATLLRLGRILFNPTLEIKKIPPISCQPETTPLT
jgi:pyridoxal phosphate enzyme (YggS family)